MSDLTVNPWKRHGKDRLYVNLPDGTAVAWADRATKVVTIKAPKYRDEALAVLQRHLGMESRSPLNIPVSPYGALLHLPSSSTVTLFRRTGRSDRLPFHHSLRGTTWRGTARGPDSWERSPSGARQRHSGCGQSC
ncbi:NERD domain-containing protein OS=Streptomyces fumanus OX=67302 GN=GCM10018772_13670 PE=4 SV=1 [Streptomyces fumanus]|uniref:NERD domain-containing protein n=1 Tax=Streptomyces fumanus TaxID=67302 RepID=A0A919DYK1_9ACTN|nr:hypothetical protein GCM10018772_13670 [Streptomyces fumanus]